MLIECALAMALQMAPVKPGGVYALQPVVYVTKVPKFKRRALKTARTALDIAGAAAGAFDAYATDDGIHSHAREANPLLKPVVHSKLLLSATYANEYATGYALATDHPKLAYAFKLAMLGMNIRGARSWYTNNYEPKPPVCWNSRLGVIPC